MRGFATRFVFGALLVAVICSFADTAQAGPFRRRAAANNCCCSTGYGYGGSMYQSAVTYGTPVATSSCWGGGYSYGSPGVSYGSQQYYPQGYGSQYYPQGDIRQSGYFTPPYPAGAVGGSVPGQMPQGEVKEVKIND